MKLVTGAPDSERHYAFLLVSGDRLDGMQDIPLHLIETYVEFFPANGGESTVTSPSVLRELNSPGWYSLLLPSSQVPGTIVVTIHADGSWPWRDSIQVESAPLEGIAQIIADELGKWSAELTVPLKLVRTGTST